MRLHEKFEGDLNTIKESIAENLGMSLTANNRLAKILASTDDLLRQCMTEADRYSAQKRELMEREEYQYEVFGEDADILVSAMSNTHLKEIANLVKVKGLSGSDSKESGNFVGNAD